MKKSIFLSIMLGFMPMMAQAGNVDVFLGDLWKGVSASSNFHVLDNASAVMFKDLNRHAYYGGLGTTIYSYKYLDLNFYAMKPLANASNYLPGAGPTFQAGRYLYDKVSFVHSSMDALGKAAPLISYGTLGVSGFRNFATGEFIWCIQGGLVSKFGPGGN